MKNNIFLVMMLVLMIAGSCIAQQPVPVKVDGGLLQGTTEDGLTVYRGIPFAAPPVGDLRWRAPQPAVKWEGVRQVNQVCSWANSGLGFSVRKERRLPVLEHLDAGEIRERPYSCIRLDLWRRI